MTNSYSSHSISVVSGHSRSRMTRPIPTFAPLVSNAFDHLLDLTAKITLPRGSVLVSQGVFAEDVSLIQDGVVKLFSRTKAGRNLTIGLRSSGWYAGAAAVLLHVQSSYSVVTLTRCSVIRCPARTFVQKLTQDIPLAMHFLSTMANETIGMSQLRMELIAHTAEERLSVFIEEQARNTAEGMHTDTLADLTQVDIARLLSLTPEHLNRILRKMKCTPAIAT